MDRSMQKTESGRSKARRDPEKEDVLLKEGLNQLVEELVNIAEEIERVSTEGSTLEDIEGCKVLAAGVLGKYSTLQNRLGGRERMQLEESLGPAVDRIRKGLTLLKEAPE